MGRTVTDMDAVRSMAVKFLYVDIAETKMGFIASHPFTNSWVTSLPKDGERFGEMVDLHNEDSADRWREHLREQIDRADLLHIFMMMNKPYILNFIKFIEPYLNDSDLGYVLGSWWMMIEQISLDDSITGQDIVEWFTRADKDKLMDEDDRACYNALPEMVTVYRGVTSYNKSRKKAFSWSTSRKTAEWFANRFQTGTGEVWTLTVPRERILCSFEGRGEHEVIVNLYGFNEKPLVEKV